MENIMQMKTTLLLCSEGRVGFTPDEVKYLGMSGFETVETDMGKLELRLKDGNYDLVILRGDGPVSVGLTTLRVMDRKTPAIVISSNDHPTTVLNAFRDDADDFLHAPYNYAELECRINAILRRCGPRRPKIEGIYRLGELVFNTEMRELSRPEEGNVEPFFVKLPPKESFMLSILCANMGKVVKKKDLCFLIWGDDTPMYENSLRVFASHLRKHLEVEPSVELSGVGGIGYGINISEDDSGPEKSGASREDCGEDDLL